MKKIILLFLAALLSACRLLSPTNPPLTPVPQLGVPFTLKIWEEAILEDELTVWFESVVSDNRCPQNFSCIVAGAGVITLGVRTTTGEPALLELNTDPYIDPAQGAGANTVTFQNYMIQLAELNPYPIDVGPALEDYEAVLIITRTDN